MQYSSSEKYSDIFDGMRIDDFIQSQKSKVAQFYTTLISSTHLVEDLDVQPMKKIKPQWCVLRIDDIVKLLQLLIDHQQVFQDAMPELS